MSKIKYYYNGKVVRTSNNEYRYGIAWNDKIVACCSRKDLAQKKLNEEIRYNQDRIAAQISFLQEAKTTTKWDTYIKRICADYLITREQYLEKINKYLEHLKNVKIQAVKLDMVYRGYTIKEVNEDLGESDDRMNRIYEIYKGDNFINTALTLSSARDYIDSGLNENYL